MTSHPQTPLLDTVDTPADLRRLERSDLRQLADELRAEMIDAVGSTGGHLGSGLGVVELTVAAHYVFDTPRDRLTGALREAGDRAGFSDVRPVVELRGLCTDCAG